MLHMTQQGFVAVEHVVTAPVRRRRTTRPRRGIALPASATLANTASSSLTTRAQSRFSRRGAREQTHFAVTQALASQFGGESHELFRAVAELRHYGRCSRS